MTAISVFFYVQHLLGIGHLTRSSHIARALAAAGFDVTFVSGGKAVEGYPGPGITLIQLPPLSVRDGKFKELLTDSGELADDAFRARRVAALLAAYHAARPRIVMTELFPFGRTQMQFELLPLMAAIEATAPRPLVVASVRDILQRNVKPARSIETVDLVRRHYDRVLVHGDPLFAKLGDTFPLADRIDDKVIYTGVVRGDPPAAATQQFDVIVSAGGGAMGAEVVRSALAAAALLPDLSRWCVIAGPNLDQATFAQMQRDAPPTVQLERFRNDFTSLLTGARLSVSQAGYNTVGDILQAGCRAVLVPFSTFRETEQADRADRLARIGRATVLPETELNGANLAAAIREALSRPVSPQALAIETDGARRTAEILRDLVV